MTNDSSFGKSGLKLVVGMVQSVTLPLPKRK